jgi:hypothetical protein
MIRFNASSERPASDPYAGNDKTVLVEKARARTARKRFMIGELWFVEYLPLHVTVSRVLFYSRRRAVASCRSGSILRYNTYTHAAAKKHRDACLRIIY